MPGVVAQLDCGRTATVRLEAQRPALFLGQQFHLGPRHRLELVLVNRLGVLLGDELVERLVDDRRRAVVLLEDFARHFARPEARDFRRS